MRVSKLNVELRGLKVTFALSLARFPRIALEAGAMTSLTPKPEPRNRSPSDCKKYKYLLQTALAILDMLERTEQFSQKIRLFSLAPPPLFSGCSHQPAIRVVKGVVAKTNTKIRRYESSITYGQLSTQ